jgi:hypothetical protein
MTYDDRTAWRYYAGAALTGMLATNPQPGDVTADDIYKAVIIVANAMLAAEKERFPDMNSAKIEQTYQEWKASQIDPLAGTANDGE